jgi:hypothetical protein
MQDISSIAMAKKRCSSMRSGKMSRRAWRPKGLPAERWHARKFNPASHQSFYWIGQDKASGQDRAPIGDCASSVGDGDHVRVDTMLKEVMVTETQARCLDLAIFPQLAKIIQALYPCILLLPAEGCAMSSFTAAGPWPLSERHQP